MEKIEIQISKRCEAIDITSNIQKIVSKSSIRNGICIVFVPHTTAAITINENADPSVMRDLMNHLEKIVPMNGNYAHIEGNSDAHIKASIIGSNRDIIIENSSLKLGTWQGIFFLEFDGPRKREIFVEIIKNT